MPLRGISDEGYLKGLVHDLPGLHEVELEHADPPDIEVVDVFTITDERGIILARGWISGKVFESSVYEIELKITDVEDRKGYWRRWVALEKGTQLEKVNRMFRG